MVLYIDIVVESSCLSIFDIVVKFLVNQETLLPIQMCVFTHLIRILYSDRCTYCVGLSLCRIISEERYIMNYPKSYVKIINAMEQVKTWDAVAAHYYLTGMLANAIDLSSNQKFELDGMIQRQFPLNREVTKFHINRGPVVPVINEMYRFDTPEDDDHVIIVFTEYNDDNTFVGLAISQCKQDDVKIIGEWNGLTQQGKFQFTL
jgi:hypothetical protein